MSKKLTRKGLAFGTAVAFGLTVFGTAPVAQAAAAIEPVTLDPNGGTSFNVLSGSDFQLRTVLSKTALSEEAQDDFSGNDDGTLSDETLKFLINDPDQGLYYWNDYGSQSGGTQAWGTNNDGYEWYSYGTDSDYAPEFEEGDDNIDNLWDAESDCDLWDYYDGCGSYGYISDVADDINLVENDGVTVLDTHERPLGKVTTLELYPDNNYDSFSVDVTAWVDWNMNNVIDANESKSETRTINFVGYQDVNVAASFDVASVGDSYVEGTYDLSTGLVSENDNQKLNTIQMDYQNDERVYSYLNFEANDSDDASIEFSDRSTSWWYELGTEGRVGFSFDLDGSEELVPGTLSLDLYQDDEEYITSIDQDVLETYPDSLTAELKDTANTTKDGLIKTGTTSAAVEVEVLDNEDDPVAAGTEVEVTVNTTPYPTVKSGDTLSVGGTAIVSRSPNNSFKLTLTTDKDGKISIPVTSTKGLAGNFVGLDIAVKSDDSISDSIDISWIDASADQDSTYIMEDTADSDGAASITKGGSATFTIGAFDQFGGALSGDDYYAVVYLDDSDSGSMDLQASTGTNVDVDTDGGEEYDYDYKKLAIKDGKATFKFVYNGSYIYDWVELDVAIVEADVKSGSIDSQDYDYAYQEVWITDKEDTVASAIEVYDSNPSSSGARDLGEGWDLEGTDLTAYDARTQVGTEGDYSTSNYVEGTVQSTWEDDFEGATVTVSGSGLLFEAAEADAETGVGVYGLGSLTLQADDDAEFAFYVFGNKSGEQTITLKSGSVTQTVLMTFDDAEATDATAIALNVPSVVTPGTSIAGFGTLTDKYGNGVSTDGSGASFEIKISGITGGEELFASEDSDADGRFSFGYSTAASSNGLVSIAVTYDADGDDTTTDDIVTKTSTVKVGKPSTATISGGDNKAKAVVKNSNGQSVKIYVGKVLKKTVIATSNKQAITVKVKKTGAKKVKVVVDGQKIAAKVVTIY